MERAKQYRGRFHGRIGDGGRACNHPGCPAAGEFRAPDPSGRKPGFDGPGDFQFLCLDHVRAFNQGYDFFRGMEPEDIMAAQAPYAGWERETRAFRPTAGVDNPPRWADFADPLDAIGTRFRATMAAERKDGKMISPEDRKAMRVLGLETDADRKALRTRYSDLVRQYHPDRNGGDRRHEQRLQQVIEAYQTLKGSPLFA
ncbi:J domain-containing protein [Aquisediminimonas sediminicola]|uniref:J domain-containing protein n=1 Tax=Alteraquisediminimonas sediminicola TaxID=2676787 RepID=UPI001C8F0856|nr:J domain-containing protein [Aquisediminimonas sediminicola]